MSSSNNEKVNSKHRIRAIAWALLLILVVLIACFYWRLSFETSPLSPIAAALKTARNHSLPVLELTPHQAALPSKKEEGSSDCLNFDEWIHSQAVLDFQLWREKYLGIVEPDTLNPDGFSPYRDYADEILEHLMDQGDALAMLTMGYRIQQKAHTLSPSGLEEARQVIDDLHVANELIEEAIVRGGYVLASMSIMKNYRYEFDLLALMKDIPAADMARVKVQTIAWGEMSEHYAQGLRAHYFNSESPVALYQPILLENAARLDARRAQLQLTPLYIKLPSSYGELATSLCPD